MLSKQCKSHLDEVGETGLQHMAQAFKVAVKLQNTKFYNSEGKSKKEAEQNAALLCLNDNLIK